MKIKPVLYDHIKTKHTSFDVDLQLEYNITFITGDSGTGKSAVFSFLEEMAAEQKDIKCFNYLDKTKNYKSAIKQSKGKLFIIDNADLLLDNSIREYIAMDGLNQYIIIGRNPTGLQLSQDEIYDLCSTEIDGKIVFTLKKAFAQTLNSSDQHRFYVKNIWGGKDPNNYFLMKKNKTVTNTGLKLKLIVFGGRVHDGVFTSCKVSTVFTVNYQNIGHDSV